MSDWQDDGNPWTVKHVVRRYENPWFAVDDHHSINPAGRDSVYGVIRTKKHAVGVLPIEPDGTVHLVGQWRFPLGRYSWEMPEGGAEFGEVYEECARRELQEETGLRCQTLQKILEMDISNSVSDEMTTLYLATGLTPGEAEPEDVEVLKRHAAPFQEVLALVASGKIRDSMTVAAVLRAHHMAVTGELPAPLAQAMLAQR